MSRVTNVIVSVGYPDHEGEAWEALLATDVAEVSPTCSRESRFAELTSMAVCDVTWGGTKFPEWDLVGAAFNYLTLSDLIDWLGSLPWQNRDAVRVIYQGEDDEAPTVVALP